MRRVELRPYVFDIALGSILACASAFITFLSFWTGAKKGGGPVPFTLLIAACFAIASLVFLYRGVRSWRIHARGVPAQAQILAVEQTASRVNGQPVCNLRLLVMLPGRQPYEARAQRIVNQIDLARLFPGAPISVLVDPEDPAQVVIP